MSNNLDLIYQDLAGQGHLGPPNTIRWPNTVIGTQLMFCPY